MPSWFDSKLKEFPWEGGKNHPKNTQKKPNKKASTQKNK